MHSISFEKDNNNTQKLQQEGISVLPKKPKILGEYVTIGKRKEQDCTIHNHHFSGNYA